MHDFIAVELAFSICLFWVFVIEGLPVFVGGRLMGQLGKTPCNPYLSAVAKSCFVCLWEQ